jgi:hypothetical protein
MGYDLGCQDACRWASGRRMGPWVGGVHTGRTCGARTPLVTEWRGKVWESG